MTELLRDYIAVSNVELGLNNSVYRLQAAPDNERVEIVDVLGRPTHMADDESDRYFTPSQETTDYIKSLLADELDARGE